MTLIDQIETHLRALPLEKQAEVLDFITFLYERSKNTSRPKITSIKKHPAFGLWKIRNIDAIQYQQNLRAEWDK